jgi:hypothetical protein
MKKLYLEVSQKPNGTIQVSIDDGSTGFRLYGPKLTGDSKTLLRFELDERAKSEILCRIDESRGINE